ncbi:MAG: sulfate transporter [Prevotella sp.]|nr:sulfate transporter [Prevotella sp.]MDE6002641.1 sulfate transporter [Prevotella sp.]MDE7456507.1 sulfate transporter [Prevotella sp.]
MESDITYYIALLALIVIGFVVVKKMASCLIKSIFTLVLVGIAAAVYWFYFR